MQRLSVYMILAGAFVTIATDTASACRFRQQKHSCYQNASVLDNVAVPTLTADSARRSLIEMLGRKDAPNFDTRRREIVALENGKNLLVMDKDAEGILSGH